MANYKVVIPFIRKVEGGLSRATTDLASKNPAPCTYNGYSDWHTNKGITWQTFSGNAKSLGYEASCKNFFEMPDWIWELIFKRLYWDWVAGDKVKSQAVANILVDFAWGAGPYTAVVQVQKALGIKPTGYLGQLTLSKINGMDDKKLYALIRETQKNYYLAIPGTANDAGWLKRFSEMDIFNSKYFLPIVASGLIAISLGLMALAAANSQPQIA